MIGEADKVWDVAIVGSGFAGALIANKLGKRRISVIILEAGAGIPPNINEYMTRFYSATAGNGTGKPLWSLRSSRGDRFTADDAHATAVNPWSKRSGA